MMPGKREDKRIIEVQANLLLEPCVDSFLESALAAIRDMERADKAERKDIRDRLAAAHRARRRAMAAHAKWFKANPLPKGGASC